MQHLPRLGPSAALAAPIAFGGLVGDPRMTRSNDLNRNNDPHRGDAATRGNEPPRPAAAGARGTTSAAPGASHTPAPPRSGKRVLVVEDERDLSELISLNLQRGGYQVRCAFDGADAVTLAKNELPDLVLLDVMLPGIDGNEVTRQLRADPRTAHMPILMLTAKSEETDIVVGLKLGADDYVTKPFSMKVLLARIERLARRAEQQSAPSGDGADEASRLRAGPLEIDPNRHEVFVDGQNVKLTLTEFKLLSALVSARGRVLSRDQLMDKAMGADVFVTDRAIDVHVTAIRKKLGDAAWLVHTVRGVGYRLRESNDGTE